METEPAELAVRPPTQRRSRASWERVLDAGLELLEEGGYEAFTIAAVCARAKVAPPAIYARAASKDALFLAVYERGMERLRADNTVFDDTQRWAGLPPEQRIREAVAQLLRIPIRHARYLRAVVLVSGVHEEVQRRGARNVQDVGERFARVVLVARDAITHDDPEAAVRTCFGSLIADSIIRLAYGPGFTTASPVDDDTFVAELGELAVRYLLGPPRHQVREPSPIDEGRTLDDVATAVDDVHGIGGDPSRLGAAPLPVEVDL
jgi:AcrR family transcriptional regulator